MRSALMDKLLLSVEETAAVLGISPRTIYNGVAPKSKRPFPLRPKRVGRLVRFHRDDVIRFAEAL